MAYEEVMRFEFQTSEAAKVAMEEVDRFEPWDAVRSTGSSGILKITTAARDLQKIVEVFAKRGGVRC